MCAGIYKYMRIDLYDWKDTDPGILPLLVGKFGLNNFLPTQ